MIRFRPQCNPLSLSLKCEEEFETIEEMELAIYESLCKAVEYIGSHACIPEELVISESAGFDPFTGYTNVREIKFRTNCIGFCGEI